MDDIKQAEAKREKNTSDGIMGTKTYEESANIEFDQICGDETSVVEKVRSLGVNYDFNLSKAAHMSHLSKVWCTELKDNILLYKVY